MGPDGPQGTPHPFAAADLTGLSDVSQQYYRTGSLASPLDDPGFLSGVSIARLISASGAIPADVATVDIAMLPNLGTFRLSAADHDFDDPGSEVFPFELNSPPVFAPAPGQNDGSFYVAVPIRATTPVDPAVTSGDYRSLTAGYSVNVSVHLRSEALAAQAVASPASGVVVDQVVTFTGTVDNADPADSPTWTWDFRDGTTATGAEASHAFTAAGHYEVYADVRAGSASRRLTVGVDVTGPTPPPSAVTTAPGAGTGPRNAPAAGPVSGNGARVGGSAANGSGRPGPTSDPRSASGAASGSGSAAAANGAVVGYLLSDAARAAAAPRAAVVPRSNTAPAARAGLDATSLPGWAFGVAAVVVLAGLGAARERRRPTSARTRPRRKR